MRTLDALALAAAASLVTFSQASAQDQQAELKGGTAVQISGVPPAQHRMGREEAEEVSGIYQLSNGKYMRVTTRGNRLVAEIAGERGSKLVPIGNKVFIAPASDTLVSFDETSNGRTNDVVLRPRRQDSYASVD